MYAYDGFDRSLVAERVNQFREQVARRLAAGDPFLLGQSSEELCFLGRRAIATEVVPGVALADNSASEARSLRRA